MTTLASDAGLPRVLVLIGTKAQLIKMAPLLLCMDHAGIRYHLVYSGQHSETFQELESLFGLRAADDVLVPNFEAATRSSFAKWVFAFWTQVLRRVRGKAWRNCRIGLVHGDTASTLFAAVAMRIGGIRVAHVEAGLRSPKMFDPFPEEIIRRLVSRMTQVHYVPDMVASNNLARARGEVVVTGGNTLRDALAFALSRIDCKEVGRGGYAVVSIHRNENLSSPSRFDELMQRVVETASVCKVKFVLHPATRERLAKSGWDMRLRLIEGVQLVGRMDYLRFTEMLLGSSFLMTDGGSNQEEAAMLGLPTLLLRKETERLDGLGANVVLSRLDRTLVRKFVEAHANRTWTPGEVVGGSPSECIVGHLQGFLE